MAVRKIGPSWWIDFQFDDTRYRKRSPLNTKGGAQDFEIVLRSELARHGSLERLEPAPTPPQVVTFAEFAERWMLTYVAVNNKWSEQCNKRSVLRANLLPAFGDRPLDAITSAVVERFKVEQLRRRGRAGEGLRPKTLNNILTVLRKCLVTAVEWGELDQLPLIRFLKTGPVPFRYLSPVEAAALLAAAPPGPWREMVLVALHTGLRHCELAGLAWEDVNLERRTLHVVRAKVRGRIAPPKNFRSRTIPLTTQAVAALRALSREAEWVFGHATTDSRARYALRRACERAGLQRLGWHALRHTFASRLAAAGAPLKAVQDLLGHSSMAMTLRYAHLGPQELRFAVELLEDRGSGPSLTGPWDRDARRILDIDPEHLGFPPAQQSQTTALKAVV